MTKRKSILTILTVAVALTLALSFCFAKGDRFSHMQEMMQQRAEKMAEELNLTEEQQELWDEASATRQVFHEAMREDMEAMKENGECPNPRDRKGRMKGHRAMHRAMAEEMQKDSPDFAAVTEAFKSEYDGPNTEQFNAMLDAATEFHQSLTAEQREIWVEQHEKMRPPMGRRSFQE